MRDRDTLLGDRYRLDSRIAVGGMGEVWRAEDTVLHRTVAVKVLKSELTQDPTFLERFRTEARTTASLQHAGIASVFDYGEAPAVSDDAIPVAYLVMEYVQGEPLSAQLARDGRLPSSRVLEIVRQAALALSEAHRVGMVHRDVKPGNLLVRRTDGTVKITDFGIARAADAVPLTQNGMVVGTAQYFSPEQAEGRAVGPPSDVYSLGVVAYECLAGRLPFVADSPVTVAMMQIRDVPPPLPPDVPAPVQALVLRALAKDPRQRFGSGAELADAVRAVQAGRPLPAPVPVRPVPVAPVRAAGGPGAVTGPGPFPAQSGAAGLGAPAHQVVGLSPPAPAGHGTPSHRANPTGHPNPPGHPNPTGHPNPPGHPNPTGQAAGPAAPAGQAPGRRAAPADRTGPPAPGPASTPPPSAGPAPPAGPASTPPPPAGPANPAGPGGTGDGNPALLYPPWVAPSAAGTGTGTWTGPTPDGRPQRRGSRRPLWIALVLLLVLILAGVATVFLSERGDDNAAGRPAAFLHSTTTDTLRVR